MSLHQSCTKCGKYLGGLALADDVPLEEALDIYNEFFTANALNVCDEPKTCYYAKRNT